MQPNEDHRANIVTVVVFGFFWFGKKETSFKWSELEQLTSKNTYHLLRYRVHLFYLITKKIMNRYIVVVTLNVAIELQQSEKRFDGPLREGPGGAARPPPRGRGRSAPKPNWRGGQFLYVSELNWRGGFCMKTSTNKWRIRNLHAKRSRLRSWFGFRTDYA